MMKAATQTPRIPFHQHQTAIKVVSILAPMHALVIQLVAVITRTVLPIDEHLVLVTLIGHGKRVPKRNRLVIVCSLFVPKGF